MNNIFEIAKQVKKEMLVVESLKIIRYTVYSKIKAIIEEQKSKLLWKYN